MKAAPADAWLSPQFADGVYLVLLMGLLEGYFVPLHSFFLTPDSFEQKVRGSGRGEAHSPCSAHLPWACPGGDGLGLLARPLLPADSRHPEPCSLPFVCP